MPSDSESDDFIMVKPSEIRNAAQEVIKNLTPEKSRDSADMANNGHGVQVVNVTADHKYELNELGLEQVLMREDIKDLPVVVVSVAGAYRGGKSFLLNFFLRYLYSSPMARADGSWLTASSSTLSGFSWRGGSERNTTGILLWSKPTIALLPSGEKVAILLMDTQGTFDSSSTVRDCSTIFALSTLLSSIQIYNISQNIQEDDLQHLQLFTEYGKLITEGGGKAFQILEFLVRDWQFPWEHPYGIVGGQELLDMRLKDDPSMVSELRDLRKHIRSSFDKVSCFLMPHPGFAVLNPSFTGNINEISPDFKQYLKLLVSSIFGQEKLQPKLISGERVKAKNLCNFFKEYMKIFNSGKIPSPTSIMEATAKAGLLTAYLEGLAQYMEDMTKECGEKELCVPPEDIKILHDRYKNRVLTWFTEKKKMGSDKDANDKKEELSKEIDSRVKEFALINMSKQFKAIDAAKEAYEAEIAKASNGLPFCVHPKDLEIIHSNGVKASMRVFDGARKRISRQPDKGRDIFEEGMKKKYTLLKMTNDHNNIIAIGDCRIEYWEYMEIKGSVEPPLSRIDLQKEHEIGLERALESFKKKRSKPDYYNDDLYKTKLIDTISTRFAQIKTMNLSKHKKLIMAAFTLYVDHINSAWDPKTECLHPEDLKKEHETAVCKALQSLRPSKQCDAGFNTTDEDEQALQNLLNLRYTELVDANVAANKLAVQSALNVFKETLERRESPNWWWLAVVPMVVSVVKTFTLSYHQESKQDALVDFYKKRRNKGNENTDIYRMELIEIIDNSNSWTKFWKNVNDFFRLTNQ